MSNRRKNSQKVNQKVLIATVDIRNKGHYGYWRCCTGADCRGSPFLRKLLFFAALNVVKKARSCMQNFPFVPKL